MEWTHWATRMYPSLRLQDVTSSPYTADQRETIKKINENISLNTLSRIWQVMIAAVPELQSSNNQKQCFDMLIIRLMHIADMPPVSELLKQATEKAPVKQVEKTVVEKSNFLEINTSDELANALQNTRELLLYSYYTSNLEITEFANGTIKYFDRKGDKDFTQKLSLWLKDKTGKNWKIELIQEAPHQQTLSEHTKSEIEADPMVASAMDLFEDAEIVNISK
jgi:DNA polymerase-3 subunit gamma/tau